MPDDDLDQDQTDLVPRSHIRQLEEKAKKAGELEQRLAAMERESAFARALGTTDHPARSYFEKGYDGELDPEAIRNAAREAGLFTSQAPPADSQTDQQNQPSPQEMAAQARMQAAAEGAQGNRPVDFVEALGPRGSKTPEEIEALARAAGLRLAADQQ